MDAFIAAMLEETISNTAVFTVEQPTLTDRTVHLDTVHFQPQESHCGVPPKEELLEEQPKPHPPQEKTRMKKGSFYLVVTMAATLLVLALGTPRLIRAISSNWNQASEPAFSRSRMCKFPQEPNSSNIRWIILSAKKPRRCLLRPV